MKLKKIGATVVMAGAGMIAFALPALAADYSSSANYVNEISTPSLESTSPGGHTAKATGVCDSGAVTPEVEVVQDFYFEPNSYLGRKAFRCDNVQRTNTWSSDDSGDHFVNFYSNGTAVSVQFTWTYPR